MAACSLTLGTMAALKRVYQYQCETVWPLSLCDSGTSVLAHPTSRKVISQTAEAGWLPGWSPIHFSALWAHGRKGGSQVQTGESL